MERTRLPSISGRGPRPIPTSRGAAIGALLVLGLLVGSCGGGTSSPPLAPSPTPAAVKPDLVLVLTDDLDLRTTRRMPRLTAFAESGVQFTQSFVVQSVCGPSRVSLLTGQYPHNHGATSNDRAFPMFRSSRGEDSTLATWLRSGGYRTALIGKYSNGYPLGAPPNYIPPGWDQWFVHLTANLDERYYVYTLNENGVLYDYGRSDLDYDTDVIGRKSTEVIRRHASTNGSEPLFLFLSVQAPHEPATYANRHRDLFAGQEGEVERVPSFNEGIVTDKPAWVQNTPPLTSEDERRLDNFQQARLRTLVAVEELLESVVAEMRASRPGRPFYVVFTSDNGLLLGEHRISRRKGNPYEEAIRVPLFVVGPGVTPRQSVDDFALNIDLAPTLLDLAGLPVPSQVDGRSLVPFLRGQRPASWRTDFLVEDLQGDLTGTLRTPAWSYTEWGSGELELYDMKADPWQMDSLHRRAQPSVLDAFAKRLHALEACRGSTCRD